eukprot:5116418-Alexandrium_andersonii.AAC.1
MATGGADRREPLSIAGTGEARRPLRRSSGLDRLSGRSASNRKWLKKDAGMLGPAMPSASEPWARASCANMIGRAVNS